MNLAAMARIPCRKARALTRWNLIVPFHSFATAIFASLSSKVSFLLEYQFSSTGAQIPKSRPEPSHCVRCGHQLLSLRLCLKSKNHKLSARRVFLV